jgi:hypothetical protein
MDLIDLWWNASQESAINDLRAKLGEARVSSTTTIARQAELIRLLQQETDDLRLRVGVLIRLLIQQGTLSAEQYTAAVNEAKASIALTQAQSVLPRGNSHRPKTPKPNPAKP